MDTYTNNQAIELQQNICFIAGLKYVVEQCEDKFKNDKATNECVMHALVLSAPLCKEYSDLWRK